MATFLLFVVLYGVSQLGERSISYEFVHALTLSEPEKAALVEEIKLSEPAAERWSPECPAGRDAGYVPKDLEDALLTLACSLEPDALQEMYESPRSELVNYHFGLGLWMRNSWGLWTGSPLKSDLESRGVSHPDNMSGLIIEAFWRRLRGHPETIGTTPTPKHQSDRASLVEEDL